MKFLFKKTQVCIYLKKLVKVNRKFWIITIFGSSLSTVPWVISTLLMAVFEKKALDALVVYYDITSLAIITILMLVIMRIFVVFGYYLNSWASGKLIAILQSNILNKFIYDVEEKDEFSDGDMTTRLISDCSDKLGDFYFQGFGIEVLEPFIEGIIAIIVIIVIDIRFLIATVISGCISLIISLSVSSKVSKYNFMVQKSNSNLIDNYTEVIKGMTTIKNHFLCNSMCEKLKKEIDTNADSEYKMDFLSNLVKYLSNLLSLINIIVCFLLAIYMNRYFDFNIANMVIIIQMMPSINKLIFNFGAIFNYLIKIVVNAKRVFEIAEYTKESKKFRSSLEIDRLEELSVSNLSFGYKDVFLRNINFSVKANELVIITGKSGSGKTTLLKILAGLERNYNGEVEINNMNIKNKEIISIVSLFQQFPTIFNRSVFDNVGIVCGESVNESKLNEIVMEQPVFNFINRSQKGIYMDVGEFGNKLSGGEKELVSFLRILSSNAKILLIDEPTAAMDMATEVSFINLLLKKKKEKIIIVVSHRDSLFKYADRIINID